MAALAAIAAVTGFVPVSCRAQAISTVAARTSISAGRPHASPTTNTARSPGGRIIAEGRTVEVG